MYQWCLFNSFCIQKALTIIHFAYDQRTENDLIEASVFFFFLNLAIYTIYFRKATFCIVFIYIFYSTSKPFSVIRMLRSRILVWCNKNKQHIRQQWHSSGMSTFVESHRNHGRRLLCFFLYEFCQKKTKNINNNPITRIKKSPCNPLPD